MIPHGVDIYLGVEPIDLRWGFDRLCGVVSERIGRRPRSGAIFAFFGRRRTGIRCVRTVARAARRRDTLPGAVRQLAGGGGIFSQPISCSSSTGSS